MCFVIMVCLKIVVAGRGRPRKKVIYEEIDDRTTDSDTDRADSQYSGSTVVNSPMSVSTETEEFEIQINEDTDSTQFLTDSHDLEVTKLTPVCGFFYTCMC